MSYRIAIAVSARHELLNLPAFIKRPISDAFDQQLVHTPLIESKNRKPLRDEVTANFVFVPPMWEVRIGDYRVFYDVDSGTMTVNVRAVRQKLSGRTTDEVLHE